MKNTNTDSVPDVLKVCQDRVSHMLEKRGYDKASIDGFLPKLNSAISHDALKDAKPEHLASYVERLLKDASKTANNGAIPLHFSAKDVPLEILDVKRIITMATPHAPSPERIAKSEQNIIDLNARAAERGSYSEQLTKQGAKPHASIRTSQDKIVIGMNAIGAALFIADGIRRFANGERTIDENGNTSIKLGAMIVPALQILLGVGCAYMAHAHYNATGGIASATAR